MNDVPIGWAVLEVWAEDDYGYYLTKKKTMQVFVYPEIKCKYENGRWHLLPPRAELPPLTPLPEGPRPPVEPIVEPILPDEGVYHIRAALWQQSDGYFVGTRYDPAGIIDYNHFPNPGFSVDGQDTGVPSTLDELKVHCAPDPADDLDDDEVHKKCALPGYESERIDVITLQPAVSRELVERVVPNEELTPQPLILRKRGK